MPNQVNLLPAEKKPKPQVVKLSRTLQKLFSVLVIVFSVCVLTFVAAHFILARKLTDAETERVILKQKVSALEQTEQRLFLLKDRLEKIEKIRTGDDVSSSFEALGFINSILNDQTRFTELGLEEDKINITIDSQNSAELDNFLNKLTSQGRFQEVYLSTLDLGQDKNYKVTLRLLEQ